MDLHTEWPLVRAIQAATTRSDHGLGDALLALRGDDAGPVTYEASIER